MVVYAALLLSSALLSYALVFPVRWVALKLDIVDRPDARKMHQIPVPLMGGLAIFISFWVVLALAFIPRIDSATSGWAPYFGFLGGALVMLALGIYDDIRGLKAPAKFTFQTLAALIVALSGTRIDLFTNPLGDSFQIGWLSIPLTVFWIVGVTNAVNLIDGLDGLATGIGAIAALGLFAVAYPGSTFVATTAIILAGALLGFLKHNFYPAKIFLGDTGSMFIGFALAVVGLHGSFKATTATVLIIPIIVLGIPIFDTLFAILRRAHRRVNPFRADREHIHHRLVRIGLHHRNVVLVLYFVCIYLALTAYSISQLPRQAALGFLVLLAMAGIIGLRSLQFVEERLELGLAAISKAKESKTSRGRRNTRKDNSLAPSTLLVCDVGSFRSNFGLATERDKMQYDIESMLIRRVAVHSVVVEPGPPGHMLILIRTSRLSQPMTAVVKNGLAWYLEDHRGAFGTGEEFPAIRWLEPGPLTAQGTRPGKKETGSSKRPRSTGRRVPAVGS